MMNSSISAVLKLTGHKNPAPNQEAGFSAAVVFEKIVQSAIVFQIFSFLYLHLQFIREIFHSYGCVFIKCFLVVSIYIDIAVFFFEIILADRIRISCIDRSGRQFSLFFLRNQIIVTGQAPVITDIVGGAYQDGKDENAEK